MKIINELLSPVNKWLDTLELRERRIVITGAISLFIMLLYLVIWEPITTRHEQQQQEYESQRQLYHWIKQATAEIDQLKSSGSSNIAKYRNQSIASLTDRSATTTGIKPYIEKLEQSNDGVKASIKSADFDRIVVWLTDLENKYGIIASNVKVEKAKTQGAVDAHITLLRAP